MSRHLPSILAGIGAAFLALASVLLIASREVQGFYNALGTMVFGLAAVAAAYALRLYREEGSR